MSEQFKPNTTVAAVIHHRGKCLYVEEIDDNRKVLNQPAGHVEPHESLVDAVKREVWEETGLHVEPSHLCGIYYYFSDALQTHFLRFCFVVELDHQPECFPQDDDIIGTCWLTLEELAAQPDRWRSAMVMKCLEDFSADAHIPLSAIKSNL